MPIPVRSHSPIKANSAAGAVSSAPRRTRSDEKEAKEPTRLTSESAAVRATSGLSASKPSELKSCHLGPGHGRGQGAKVGSSNASRVAKSLHAPSKSLSVSHNNGGRTVPMERASTASSRAQHAAHKSLSGPTRPNGLGDSSSRPNITLSTRAMSSTLVTASPSVSARASTVPSTKPNFSTYQQHYSPKKPTIVAGAPAVVSQKLPPSFGSAGHVISSKEFVNLQDELLQLELLYEKSAATLQAYETSMKTRLGMSYDQAESQLSLLQSLQRERQARINALAMSEWLEHEEHTQVALGANCDALLLLAHCIKELHDVSDEDGSLDQAMKMFGEWCAYMSSRRSKRMGEDQQNRTNEELGPNFVVAPQWSALVSSVQDQVEACAASLKGLQWPRAESSSISSLINVHINLTEQMLQEIATCSTIADLIVREEDEWLGRAVQHALQVCDAELHHLMQAARPSRSASPSTRRGVWERDMQETVTL